MSRFRNTVKEITLDSAAVTAQTEYVWDAPVSEPIKNMTIFMSSEGRPHGAGDLEWEVYYVSKWDGVKFDSDSTPTVGVIKGSGTFVCPVEISEQIWEDSSIIIPNKPEVSYSTGTTSRPIDKLGLGGPAIVLKVTNVDIASEVNLVVCFVSETLSNSI